VTVVVPITNDAQWCATTNSHSIVAAIVQKELVSIQGP